MNEGRRSIKGIVHVEEYYSEKPDGDDDVVDGYPDVLFPLLHLHHQCHCM